MFDCAQSVLADVTLFATFAQKRSLALLAHASDVRIGAPLEQLHNGLCAPTSFFSRKSSSVERHYNAFKRELLAVYTAIPHFRDFVEAKPFIFYTDHKLRSFAFASSADHSLGNPDIFPLSLNAP